MTEIVFVVPGDAVGKGRPRAARTRAGVRMYTPAKTEQYERLVQHYAMSCNGMRLLEGPLQIELDVGVSIPASWSNKRKAAAKAGREMPAKKPDADNILKAICDSLNGIAYRDDAQIVRVVLGKRYMDEPQTMVAIKQIGGSA